MDTLGFRSEEGFSPGPASFWVADHLNLVDDSNVVIFMTIQCLNRAWSQVADSEFFVLACDKVAILQLLLHFPSQKPQWRHVNALAVFWELLEFLYGAGGFTRVGRTMVVNEMTTFGVGKPVLRVAHVKGFHGGLVFVVLVGVWFEYGFC